MYMSFYRVPLHTMFYLMIGASSSATLFARRFYDSFFYHEVEMIARCCDFYTQRYIKNNQPLIASSSMGTTTERIRRNEWRK